MLASFTYFTSHIVHIKRGQALKENRAVTVFTSHIVHIKQVALVQALREAIPLHPT